MIEDRMFRMADGTVKSFDYMTLEETRFVFAQQQARMGELVDENKYLRTLALAMARADTSIIEDDRRFK